MSITRSNMKVIIVGGGPVGLTAAHALTQAGINFVLLEARPSAVIDAGSNLVLQTEGLTKLRALGILPQILAVSTELSTIDRVNHKGRSIGNVNWFLYQKKNTGFAPRGISRHDLTNVLYSTLPAEKQANIIPNKKLVGITNTSTGVTVTCADGSAFEGSMVIGADGAHSKTRSQMRSLALSSTPEKINEEVPFLTTYNCLWIRTPISKLPGVHVGMSSESHGSGLATQLFAGDDTAVLGIYEPLAKPTKERQYYTHADEEALVERWGHVRLLKGHDLTLGDFYNNKIEAGLVTLEEGVLDHWNWNSKVVLIGDAAHKYTPSTGNGCNNGMMDAWSLVNELTTTLGQDEHVEAADIEAAFSRYQNLRKDLSIETCAASGQATAMATWSNSILSFIDVHVIPRSLVQSFLGNRIRT